MLPRMTATEGRRFLSNPKKLLLELGLTLILGQVKEFWKFPRLLFEAVGQVDPYLRACLIEILLLWRTTSYLDRMIDQRVAAIPLHLALTNKQGVFVPTLWIADFSHKYFNIVKKLFSVFGK